MGPIIPRWEWRTFGLDFGAAEPHLAALVPEKIQESEEIYLLGPGDEANVKVRDALMDIKILEHVDKNGLEQWRPVFKAPFPLDAAGVRQVCRALGAPEHGSTTAPALEDLLAELAAAGGVVQVIQVSKTRHRHRIGGCVAENAEVTANGTRVRTIAIEDEDPERVVAAVRLMELDCFPNTSYPRGLRRILGRHGGGSR